VALADRDSLSGPGRARESRHGLTPRSLSRYQAQAGVTRGVTVTVAKPLGAACGTHDTGKSESPAPESSLT
jgi:hypothetical protein